MSFSCELGDDEEDSIAAVHVAFSSDPYSIQTGAGSFGACVALSAHVGMGNAQSG